MTNAYHSQVNLRIVYLDNTETDERKKSNTEAEF